MNRPKIQVVFTDGVTPIVRLKTSNAKELLGVLDVIDDADGVPITLFSGLEVEVFEPDYDMAGVRDDIFATGIVERNPPDDRYSYYKWRVNIDSLGIRNRSNPNQLAVDRSEKE